MDIFSIECFLEVAKAKNFTKASQALGRTQSAITQQISKLEKTMETQLFERGKHSSLTTQGELFLSYALKIYGLHRELLDRFKQPELDGEVRFGIPEDFATLMLTDVLVNFSREHPRISLNVECDLTWNLFDRFQQEKLDLVLVKMRSSQHFPSGVEIWKEPLVWVGKENCSYTINENTVLPLILFPAPCVYRCAGSEALHTKNISSKVVFTSPSYAGIIAAVRANLGLTILPSTLIPQGLEPIEDPSLPPLPQLHVSLLCKEHPSPAISSLKDYLLKKIGPLKSRIV